MTKSNREPQCAAGTCHRRKIDGSSIVLYFEEGHLVRRGDTRQRAGRQRCHGQRADHPGCPACFLPEAVEMVLRGGNLIPADRFAEYNRSQDGIYANPRNLAAGRCAASNPAR